MATKISAAANPALANDIINKAFAEEQVFEAPKIIPPSDTTDRKSTRLNSSHSQQSRMPSSA